MKLSILDQAPIALGKNAREALMETIHLAKLGETLGFQRYWIAEHHDLAGLACPAPEVMLSTIGSNTERIRIGAGAVLLPHYKPFKVVETFNVLATMYPDRIDLGLGRSPGGSAEASIALSGNFLENVSKMPELVDELLHFLHNNFDENHIYSKIKPSPIPEILPEPWLLGTSGKSALLAAEKGLHYAFGHFMSEQDAAPIIASYKKEFVKQHPNKEFNVILAVQVICAETSEEAEQLALSSFKWRKSNFSNDNNEPLTTEEQEEFLEYKSKLIMGNPAEVKEKLLSLANKLEVDELMILTNTTTYEARRKSYELVAKAFQ